MASREQSEQTRRQRHIASIGSSPLLALHLEIISIVHFPCLSKKLGKQLDAFAGAFRGESSSSMSSSSCNIAAELDIQTGSARIK